MILGHEIYHLNYYIVFFFLIKQLQSEINL